MKVSIIGITGFTGGVLAAELLHREHTVTGGARSIDAGPPPGVDGLVEVDIHRPETLPAAFDGADAVIVSVQPLADDRTLTDAVPDLLEAAHSAGARLLFVGGAGSLHVPGGQGRLIDQPEFPAAWRPGAEVHAIALEALERATTEADWVVVSPSRSYGRMVAGERRGTYRIGGDELLFDEAGESHIGAEDFAIAIVDELEEPKHRRTRFTVGY